MITVRGLRKAFGEHTVLDGVDLDVPAGSVLALLGPNGAGKTTVVKILSTLLAADGGTATVAGHDVAREPDAVRARIGVTGQFSAVDSLLTGRENLRLMADLRHLGKAEGRRRSEELVERFALGDAAARPAGTYSGGTRRRLDLAMTLIGDPEVIYLDEPTTGLDPRSRRDMWEVVDSLVAGGVTVLLTTQYLEEADRLASRVAVLDGGRIVAQGTPAELKGRTPGGHLRLHFTDLDDVARAALVVDVTARDDAAFTLDVAGDGSPSALREVLDRLAAGGVEPDRLTIHSPGLDDVFLALTEGSALR